MCSFSLVRKKKVKKISNIKSDRYSVCVEKTDRKQVSNQQSMNFPSECRDSRVESVQACG